MVFTLLFNYLVFGGGGGGGNEHVALMVLRTLSVFLFMLDVLVSISANMRRIVVAKFLNVIGLIFNLRLSLASCSD